MGVNDLSSEAFLNAIPTKSMRQCQNNDGMGLLKHVIESFQGIKMKICIIKYIYQISPCIVYYKRG
eukprot:c36033_g1_i1 orf=76-273(-)